MKKWNLPLTYAPKIQPVIDGTCRQTIRTGRKFSVGDTIRFYTWAGRPYHSKRTTSTEYTEIRMAKNITILPKGIVACFFSEELHLEDGVYARCTLWTWDQLDELALLDGIVPPTGEALRDVLMSKNKIPATGIDSQIVRW
jgi:hypothetical protein